MIIKRRNFIQITTLSLTTAVSGYSLPLFLKPTEIANKPLTVNMESSDGNYEFFVDGRQQVITIKNQVGNLTVPEHSCTLEYTAADGLSKISVYIDQGTIESFLLPGFPTEAVEVPWAVTLLGNPIRNGKIVTNIVGPSNTNPLVEITDVQGRTLVKKKVNKTNHAEEFEFDVQRYAKGILIMKVSCEDFSQVLKVVHGN